MYAMSVKGLREVIVDLRYDAISDKVQYAIENVSRAAKLEYLADFLEREQGNSSVDFGSLAVIVGIIGDDIGPTMQTIVEETFAKYKLELTPAQFSAVLKRLAA